PGWRRTAGAFGLGGPLPAVGDATASLVPGLYAFDAATGSTGGPAGVQRGALLHARRGAGAGETQLLVVEAGSAPNVTAGLAFARARSGGAWTAWTCGSVSQSDLGANGRVLRRQRGTQTGWSTPANPVT